MFFIFSSIYCSRNNPIKYSIHNFIFYLFIVCFLITMQRYKIKMHHKNLWC
nr:MAG TPA: hypothetical protein [Caudoviricetes sp.]